MLSMHRSCGDSGLAARVRRGGARRDAFPTLRCARMEPVFEAAGVLKRYGAAGDVGPIDLSLPQGSTTALIGPSGAGKSTLLRMLNGLIWPDAGEVKFRGAPLAREGLPAFRRQIGYVVQGGGLFPHLNAWENAALVARWLR